MGIGPDSEDAVKNNAVKNNTVSLGQGESKKKKKKSVSILSNKLSFGRCSKEELLQPDQGSPLRGGDFQADS